MQLEDLLVASIGRVQEVATTPAPPRRQHDEATEGTVQPLLSDLDLRLEERLAIGRGAEGAEDAGELPVGCASETRQAVSSIELRTYKTT